MVRQSQKVFFQVDVSSKKRTKEFDFTTMIPQVDLFSFAFWRKSKTPINHFEIIWPLGGAKDEHFSCFHRSCQLGEVVRSNTVYISLHFKIFSATSKCHQVTQFVSKWITQKSSYLKISEFLKTFWYSQFFQKTNENNSTWGIKVPELLLLCLEFFPLLFGRIEDTKRTFPN